MRTKIFIKFLNVNETVTSHLINKQIKRGVTQNNIIARFRSVNITPYSRSKENKRETGHTTISITKHNKVRQYSKIKPNGQTIHGP